MRRLCLSDVNRGLCSSDKRIYNTRESALEALRVYKRRGSKVKRVYKCEECGRWHMTKMTAAQWEKEKQNGRESNSDSRHSGVR